MSLRKNYFLLAFVLFPSLLWAQGTEVTNTPSNNAPKYSNEFLRIGIGARAFGMGNAQIAIADDVTAGYWNPAGLASSQALPYPEISLMHASYFASIANYNYIGFTMPVDTASNRRFGVTLIRMGIDDIPNTLQLIEPDGSINYAKVQSFSESQLAALFSYAWQPRSVKGLSLGANMKLIYRGVGRFANAWGFGLDLGLRYSVKRLSLGLAVTDATQTYNAWTFNTETFEEDFIRTGNIVPQNSIEITRPLVRLGIGYDFRITKRVSFLLALDSDTYFDGNRQSALLTGNGISIDPRIGGEISYKNSQYRKVAFLRGGVYNIQQITQTDGTAQTGLFPTAGVGIVVKNFTIDYALANIGNASDNLHSHIVSLKFHIQ